MITKILKKNQQQGSKITEQRIKRMENKQEKNTKRPKGTKTGNKQQNKDIYSI